MKSILEPWRKFLVEQEGGVSGPEGVSKIATQPQRTLLTKFSLERVKPVLMSLYANAFKKIERANYARKGSAEAIAINFLKKNNLDLKKLKGLAITKRYADDVGIDVNEVNDAYNNWSKGKKSPLARRFLKWVYHTYVGPAYAYSLKVIGNPNIFYYNHESNSLVSVSEASPKNPTLIFVSDGDGGVAMDSGSPTPDPNVLGTGKDALEKIYKNSDTLKSGVAIVGLSKFTDMTQAQYTTTEELDHVLEYLSKKAVRLQVQRDDATRFKPSEKYRYRQFGGEHLLPIEDLIEDAKKLIGAFWNNALRTTESKPISSIKAVYDKVLPKAAKVRKNYGIGETTTVGFMLDYMSMNQEVKIAIQFMMEKMRKKGVKSIDNLCANFNVRQQIEQPDQSFKVSMLVPAICKKSPEAKEFREKLNTVYQERYLK